MNFIDRLTIHHAREPHPDTNVPDPHQDVFSKTVLGFWIYLMTDCVLFASLFATYAVLHHETFGGPTSKELFNLPLVFMETMILLMSSVTCGLGILAAVKGKKNQILAWLFITFILGVLFISLELHEFTELVRDNNSWRKSAFLSAFFTLVGTHGLHILTGLIWITVMIGQFYFQGITVDTFRRLIIFGMFWHFLDLIWIFIFTLVYLIGVI